MSSERFPPGRGKASGARKENHLEDKVELGGTFCMGDCVNGVNVTVDGEKHSVSPDTTEEFFQKEILAKVQ